MIKAIINGIMSLIMSLVSVILTPIDSLISSFMPSLDSAFTAIGQFINLCGQYIGWGISLLGIPQEAIALIVAYFIFSLTVPLLVSTAKLAIKWYNALKL